ncbi:MAG: stage 0 sporulation family protein [Bacteroidia bacterium]
MGCATCSNNSGSGVPAGCNNNGSCKTGGCNKLEVFDWLSDIQLPFGQKPFSTAEVRFKNGRKAYYHNNKNISLFIGDTVVVEGTSGYDVGIVSLTGELVKTQLKRKGVTEKETDLKKIYRKASQEELDKWIKVRSGEYELLHKTRKLALSLKLNMKLTDVEFQGDGSKAIFYYTAEGRVDFRELIKRMAESFKIRVEMKQIGARQEAGRLGGIGSCGRELCCSTWLTDFRSVSTNAARYQQLSLNPQKLAGQCGKLKCCLNYELDAYVEALKGFPDTKTDLFTEQGRAYCIKTDIFKHTMWFQMVRKEDSLIPGKIVALKIDRVHEIVAMNKNSEKPADLEDFAEQVIVEKVEDYSKVDAQDDLTRFDSKFKKHKSKKRNFNKKKTQGQAQPNASENKPQTKPNPNANRNNNRNRNKNNNNRPPKKD